MVDKGLAAASEETTVAPTMYQEIEQAENVARGCAETTELIAYEATKEPRRHTPEKPGLQGEKKTDREGNVLYVEIPHGPYFCQTKEQEVVFKENHPNMRIESYAIQLLKNTAKKLIDLSLIHI